MYQIKQIQEIKQGIKQQNIHVILYHFILYTESDRQLMKKEN